MKNTVLVQTRKPHHHAQVLSVAEAAREFGVSIFALCGAMKSADCNLVPQLKTGRATYYDARAMRAWWRARIALLAPADTKE